MNEPSHGSSSAARPQIASLTSLRFVAAMIVVIYHFFTLGPLGKITQLAGPVRGPIAQSLSAHLPGLEDGHLAVDFFFILSGFVLAYAYYDDIARGCFSVSQFLQRRIARTYPLHVAALAFVVAMVGIAHFFKIPLNHPQNFQFRAIGPNLLLIQAYGIFKNQTFNGPAWCVSAEWLAYLCFPLLVVAIAKSRINSLTLLVLAVGWFVGLDYFTSGAQLMTRRTYDFGILRILAEFPLGIATFRVWDDFRQSRSTALSRWHLLVWGVAIVGATHLKIDEALIVLMFPVLIFLCTAIETTHGLPWLSKPWLVYGGQISFAIFMIHIPLFAAIRRLTRLSHLTAAGTLSEDLLATACVIAIVPIAILIYERFERPAASWVLSLFQPRLSQSALVE